MTKKKSTEQDVLTKEEIALRKAIKQFCPTMWSRDIINLITPMRKAVMVQYASNLVKTFERDFYGPFLPDGFITISEEGDGNIFLRIGRRDVSIGPDGKSWGAGTSLISTWEIKEHTK